MSQSPPASASKSPPASSPPHSEADLLPPNAFSLHNLPQNATWRGVKDVINDVFPCWCMVRIVVPGIANVEVKTAQVAVELAAKLQGHDMDGFVLATQPPLSPPQAMMLQHQAMMHHQMQMGMHHPMAVPGVHYNQYAAYPQSPQPYPGAPPQYMGYMPQYVPFYPGSPPMTDTYLASSNVPDNTASQTASPSANSVASSGASSLTNSPMPYYVAPVAPDWTQTSPVYSMPMSPGFMQYGHVPRMRRFGGYGGYGGYNGSYGGGYKPRVMNFSDTPIDKQRLFVGNIPFSTTWYELKAYLGSCGPVSHVEIQTNDVGDSLGFALVTFQDEETASKAIELFDGKMFEGRALKVHYDRVPPRKTYHQHQNNHHNNHSSNNHNHNSGSNHGGAPASGSLGSSPAPAVAANGYNRYKGFKPFVPGDAGSQA
ncbi:uncharacterized protein YALI1_F12504g [Yarrowia lipolytica]|uniref:RRM domain-containing protein n=1 Tax=Yarrowia lipolytica TaxID=4952 RepID=A0A1D8NMK8_YARLL|nr:hypothetical protein YALI1_F12504g [Yarrowia lipolytica]